MGKFIIINSYRACIEAWTTLVTKMKYMQKNPTDTKLKWDLVTTVLSSQKLESFSIFNFEQNFETEVWDHIFDQTFV